MTSISALASSFYSKHISLLENQVWSASYAVTRTGDYSYASASLESVYPSSGTDNFKY